MSGGKPFDLFLNAFSRADVLSWDLSFSIFPPFNLSFQPSKVFFFNCSVGEIAYKRTLILRKLFQKNISNVEGNGMEKN